ncbi:hypothetical protein [Pseudomonas putida]
MVTDKLTLSLLSRLADAQLALATSMKGLTPTCQRYPAEALQQISQAIEQIEASLVEINAIIDVSDTRAKLH